MMCNSLAVVLHGEQQLSLISVVYSSQVSDM